MLEAREAWSRGTGEINTSLRLITTLLFLVQFGLSISYVLLFEFEIFIL